MHPTGFDTRAVVSEEAASLIAVADGSYSSTVTEKVRDTLEANSFLEKIAFIRNVLQTWIKHGGLGGRPCDSDGNMKGACGDDDLQLEIYWRGAQECPQEGRAGKFVWATVGAPGGDGRYRTMYTEP